MPGPSMSSRDMLMYSSDVPPTGGGGGGWVGGLPGFGGSSGGSGGFGGSGGGSGTSGTQAAALRQRFQSPGAVTASTEVDPREGYAYERAKDFEGGLADGTNQEITRELGRARDELSTGLERERQGAMSRGADSGLFTSRAMESGKRDIHNLQGRLADVALNKRGDAIRGLTSAAGQAAGGQRASHFGSLAARLADQRYQLDAAESQSRLQQAPYDRMMQMMETVGRYQGMLGGTGTGMIGGGSAGGGGGYAGRSPAGGFRL